MGLGASPRSADAAVTFRRVTCSTWSKRQNGGQPMERKRQKERFRKEEQFIISNYYLFSTVAVLCKYRSFYLSVHAYAESHLCKKNLFLPINCTEKKKLLKMIQLMCICIRIQMNDLVIHVTLSEMIKRICKCIRADWPYGVATTWIRRFSTGSRERKIPRSIIASVAGGGPDSSWVCYPITPACWLLAWNMPIDNAMPRECSSWKASNGKDRDRRGWWHVLKLIAIASHMSTSPFCQVSYL